MSCLFSKGACGRSADGAETVCACAGSGGGTGLWCSLAPLATPERLGWHLIRYDGTCFFFGVPMERLRCWRTLPTATRTGLISRATAEMLREKHVRRRAGVAWGTRRLVEALPVPKSESAPKSDSKSNSAPASSSPAARSDEEVDRGANEEVDDEATARTGKVRAAARRSHFTQSRAG